MASCARLVHLRSACGRPARTISLARSMTPIHLYMPCHLVTREVFVRCLDPSVAQPPSCSSYCAERKFEANGWRSIMLFSKRPSFRRRELYISVADLPRI